MSDDFPINHKEILFIHRNAKFSQELFCPIQFLRKWGEFFEFGEPAIFQAGVFRDSKSEVFKIESSYWNIEEKNRFVLIINIMLSLFSKE